ncbi:MAG: hypothetical protein KJ622_14045 [Alphaproteobacteria bacterium]|nr:hypothetical protein [Alphaproteobacteria bacterium]
MTKHASNAPDKIRQKVGADSANPGGGDFKTWINHPKSVARLQILVIVLGILVVLGFLAVIGRIAYLTLYLPGSGTAATLPADAPATRAARIPVPAAGANQVLAVTIPAGAVVEDIQPMADGWVMVRFKDPRGTGMLVIDPATGAVLRTWRFVPAQN